MTPVGTAPMSCPEARALVSERLDGASVGPAVERHLRGCAACARFEDSALTVRRALRLPSMAGGWDDGHRAAGRADLGRRRVGGQQALGRGPS